MFQDNRSIDSSKRLSDDSWKRRQVWVLFITILCYVACFSHRGLKMSEAIWDPHAYAKLTDQIVQQIQFSTDPQLQKVCVCTIKEVIVTYVTDCYKGEGHYQES